MDATLEELSVQQETEDQNYDMCVRPEASRGLCGRAGLPLDAWSSGLASQQRRAPPSWVDMTA